MDWAKIFGKKSILDRGEFRTRTCGMMHLTKHDAKRLEADAARKGILAYKRPGNRVWIYRPL